MALVAVALLRGQRLRRDPGAALVLPPVKATIDAHHVAVAQVQQCLGGECRSDATGAVHDDLRVLLEQPALDLELEVTTGDVGRPRHGALLVLVRLADVQEGRRPDEVNDIGGCHFTDVALGFVQQLTRGGHVDSSDGGSLACRW